MTKPTQEEIERVAGKIHNMLCTVNCEDFDDEDKNVAKWHLQKMAEQKVRYERLVDVVKTIRSKQPLNDWTEWKDLDETIQDLEKSERK